MTIDRDYSKFINNAKQICKDRVYTNYLLRYAYGIDASCYSYTPKVVIKVHNEIEVINILKFAKQCNTPVTFRAAGSSLSGQCSSDSVLIIANEGWKNIHINEDISIITCDCGVIASDANVALSPYSKKIGPDPATITTALIGGILNNNSSGMCCGVAENSYNTIASIRIILLDGTILDTSDENSVNNFLNTHSHIANELLKLRQEILSDRELCELIKHKYKIKNTTGYSINSILDFSDIKDIINHIFVGSEGTLGFVSKVSYYTVADYAFKGCGLLFYENLNDASKAVVKLANMPNGVVAAAEMMDYSCLLAVRKVPDIPKIIHECKPGYTCILIQSQSDDENILDLNLQSIKEELKSIPMPLDPLYSKNQNEFNSWWKIRKGILPIVAGSRRQGTTIITEDVCFTIDKFCDGVAFLRDLFKKYDFEDGVIFGHALSGNLHFNITPDLNNKKDYENFSNLVKDMSYGVVAMGGSAKAEHGTGRMVAPFVELEWGKKAYGINLAIKNIFDKNRLINPDVIISDDPEIYKKNLKSMPQSIINLPHNNDIINSCMECGFCEKHCPSRNLTLTPRQRIAVLREVSRLFKMGKNDEANELLKEYEYYGIETCATCSACYEICPLGIDTAKVANELKAAISYKTLKVANTIYHNMDKVIKYAKFGLKFYNLGSKIIGENNISNLTKNARKISKKIPFTPSYMPMANDFKFISKDQFEDKIVYFSTCINRIFKPNSKQKDKRALQEVFENICKKAHISVLYPQNLQKMCCAKMFCDYKSIEEENKKFIQSELLKCSKNGKYAVVIDHSSCFYHTVKQLNNPNLKILDMSEFLCEISPRLIFNKQNIRVLVHKMCQIKRAKKDEYIEKLAKLCSDEISVVQSFECCGFAGNKGFFTPQLNQSSTKDLKFETTSFDMGVSTSSTCEIGLSAYSTIAFSNISYLVDKATTSKL